MKQFHAIRYDDHRGFEILQTSIDREDIRQFFKDNPDEIPMGAMLQTEHREFPKTFSLQIVMLQPGIMDRGRFVATERNMTKLQALMWAEAEGKKHGYYCINEGTNCFYLVMASSKEETTKSGGKFASIVLRCTEVAFNELPDPLS